MEIISHTARLLSLTVRLWANIFASELIYVIFLGLCLAPAQALRHSHPAWGLALDIFPLLIPVAFIALHMFVAIVQAFVFTILPALIADQCETGCTRMTGTTSWRHFYKGRNR